VSRYKLYRDDVAVLLNCCLFLCRRGREVLLFRILDPNAELFRILDPNADKLL